MPSNNNMSDKSQVQKPQAQDKKTGINPVDKKADRPASRDAGFSDQKTSRE